MRFKFLYLKMAHKVHLLLGTNLGDKLQNLAEANYLIKELAGSITNQSKVYKSEPWGKIDQDEFYNQVLVIESELPPSDLLQALLGIEKELGRIRKEKWGERIIDIDILYYDSLIINVKNLTIPHPEIANRRFTLVPLIEVSKDFMHPILLKTNIELLQTCNDPLKVLSLD